jgi:hypothetical protein
LDALRGIGASPIRDADHCAPGETMPLTSALRNRRLWTPVAALLIGAAAAISASSAVASTPEGCAYDRPCIKDVYATKVGGVYLSWSATENFSNFNVRWSRPGKAVVQLEVPGGRQGSFHLKNARSRTTYTFAVQGCNTRFLASSRCSPWEPASFTTR